MSVTLGALAALLLLQLGPSNVAWALIAVVALAAASGTAGSRWYISSAIPTLLVFVMLLSGHPEESTSKLNERVGETVLGVAAAYLFGWAVPALRQRLRARS